MNNVFNKTNAPYLVSGALAIATLLASGVFAAAPYFGFLAPAAALSIGLPFVIGGAVFSAIVFALSAAVISKNKTISEKDTQLANQAKEIKGKNRDIFEKSKELKVTSSYLDAQNAKEKAEMQKQLDKKVEYIIHSDEDAERVHQERKERNREEVLDSEALGNLFRKEGNQPKLNVVAKEVEATQVAESCVAAVSILAMAALAPKLLFTPLCAQSANVGLFEQQTSPSQVGNNSTVNLPFTQHVPTPQAVLGNKINESSTILDHALESDKNNFGITKNSSEPQWYKDLHQSETTEEIIDGTVGSNQTAITKHNAAENAFMSTYGSFLRNLNPFGSREHHVNGVKDCNYQSDRLNIARSENVGSLLNSTELSKLTTEIPVQSQFVMAY